MRTGSNHSDITGREHGGAETTDNGDDVDMRTSIILDNNISGFLRRHGHNGRTMGLRRKRFYRLDGAILSKHLSEHSPPVWHANVLGAVLTRHGKTHFSLVLKDPSAQEEDSSPHASKLVLYARTEELCTRWVDCIHRAATRTLDQCYQVGDLIGEGGFASVRIGQCRRSDRIVAIKTIRKEREFMRLYGSEIAVLKRVDHINIVRTFDLFETDRKIHIVMEYMKGGMLFDAIEDGVRFSEADVAQLMREILHGVMYLHDNGIVHRDIKPENVLCTDKQPPWHVKLADFGLSKLSQNENASTDMLMRTMIGTPEFIAPEIAMQQEYTSKVDMWAVGMLMYNVTTGHLPFDYKDTDCIGQLREGLDLTFPEKEWQTFSPEARSFTRALLSPNPNNRLTALAALLHPWLDDERRFGSSRFSAHGRFSAAGRSMMSAESAGEQPSIRNGERSSNRSVFFRQVRVRPSWRVAFVAVSAMNRFLRLVRPLLPEPISRPDSNEVAIAAFSDDEYDFSMSSLQSGPTFGSSEKLAIELDPQLSCSDVSTPHTGKESSTVFASLMRTLHANANPNNTSFLSRKSKPENNAGAVHSNGGHHAGTGHRTGSGHHHTNGAHSMNGRHSGNGSHGANSHQPGRRSHSDDIPGDHANLSSPHDKTAKGSVASKFLHRGPSIAGGENGGMGSFRGLPSKKASLHLLPNRKGSNLGTQFSRQSSHKSPHGGQPMLNRAFSGVSLLRKRLLNGGKQGHPDLSHSDSNVDPHSEGHAELRTELVTPVGEDRFAAFDDDLDLGEFDVQHIEEVHDDEVDVPSPVAAEKVRAHHESDKGSLSFLRRRHEGHKNSASLNASPDTSPSHARGADRALPKSKSRLHLPHRKGG